MQTLTLLVGNAFMPHVAEQDRRHPAIEYFLSRCNSVLIHRHTSTAGWICTSLGIKRRPDWPVGAILAQARHKQDADTYWICADPVHLAVDRDSLVLQPQSQLKLSKPESLALFATLETHFAAAGLCLVHIDTGHWCFGTPDRPHLVTSELELVEGQDVNDELPSGQDSAVWQRYVTEAQMILHHHPVNVARESRGEPVANSLWFWGGGVVPQTNKTFDRIVVNEPLLRAIGTLTGAHSSEIAVAEVGTIDPGSTLAEFPGQAASDGDDVLARLESNWIAPAWQALRTGRLDKLTLVLRIRRAIVECSCDRRSRRHFWRLGRPLSRSIARLQETL